MTNPVFMQSPSGDEIKEVEGTGAALTPLMAKGWHQVPPPNNKNTAGTAAVSIDEEKK